MRGEISSDHFMIKIEMQNTGKTDFANICKGCSIDPTERDAHGVELAFILMQINC